MKAKYILYSLLMIPFLACEKGNQKTTGIFFGGQIINPSSNFVRLYRDNKKIDSLRLDKNFRFQKRFDSLESGIYKLEHIPDYQSVFLENGDSIWVRINASAFNESMVYSGSGAVKNNFLMDIQRQQQREEDFLSSKYAKDSEIFQSIIDSLLLEKKKMWIEMDSLYELSPIAQKITQAAYIYPYATKRERYALLRGTFWTSQADSIYFDYRKYLNYGDNDLALFDPYINYLVNYISEKALDSGDYYFNLKQHTDFNIKRLNAIDKEIYGFPLRNNLARAIAFEEILNFDNHQEHDRFLQYYAVINNSSKNLAEVLDLHLDISGMQAGQQLPEITLQKADRTAINSSEIIEGEPTVIYFWSQTQMKHYRNTLARVNALKTQYPKIRFIGICIQPFNDMVTQVQTMLNVATEDQFAIVNFENASKTWVITLLNKGIITDSKGRIVAGFGNFSDASFENILAENN